MVTVLHVFITRVPQAENILLRETRSMYDFRAWRLLGFSANKLGEWPVYTSAYFICGFLVYFLRPTFLLVLLYFLSHCLSDLYIGNYHCPCETTRWFDCCEMETWMFCRHAIPIIPNSATPGPNCRNGPTKDDCQACVAYGVCEACACRRTHSNDYHSC